MRLEHEESRAQGNPSNRTAKPHEFSELRSSEETCRSLVADLNDIVCRADAEGNITYISHQVESIAGYKPSELIGSPFLRLVHPEDLAGALEVWQGCQEGKVGTAECRVLVKNGRYRFARQSFRPQFEDGQFAGVAGIITDVTEQHEAESALRESEQKYRALFEQSIDAIGLTTSQGRIVEVNASWFRLFGYSPEDLEWLNARDLYAEPEDRDVFLREMAEKGSIVDGEVRHKKMDGTVMDCLRSVTVRRAADGSVMGYQTVFRDITERKRTETELLQSEKKLRFLTDNIVDIVWTADLNFHTTYVSPSIKKELGFSPDERKRQRLDEMATPDSVRGILEILQQEFERDARGNGDPERAATLEVEYYRKDGSTVWMENLVRPIRGPSGAIEGLLGVARDITDRKRAEAALRESEEEFRTLFELSRDAITLIRPDGTFIDVNQAWLDLVGYCRDDLSSFNAVDLYADPDGRKHFLERIARAGTLLDYEVQFKSKDGTVFDGLASVVARRDKDGNTVAFQSVFRDITEKKRAEATLRESEEEFRTLFELSRDAIALVRPDGTFVDVNQAWLDLFGFSREELPGITAYTVHENPEKRDAILLKELRETGGITNAELRFRKKDGTVMDCLCNIVARRDETGAITAIQSSTRDITESMRARRELQDSRDKLNELHAYLVNGREAERAAIARELHDRCSQPLNALRLDLSDARRRVTLGESIDPASLDRMVELVDDISGDVRQLSSDLRPGVLDDLGLSAAIEWNVQEFASRTGLRTSLQLTADDSAIAASCATTLFRILQELLANVVRHAQASTLSVGLRNSGDSLVLTVTDDGRGITEEELASKESLGIISIRERVNLFGGSVVIHGEPGKGTTAEVTIPVQPCLPEWASPDTPS